MTTYNVGGEVADLIDADSPEAAIKIFLDKIFSVGITPVDSNAITAFESDVDTHGEPVPDDEPFIPAVVGDPIFWILDQRGATYAYDDEVMARAQADREKDDGAVNLVLFRATVPGPIAEMGMLAVAEWAASNAEPDADAEYLTGNADDIAEKDAEDDALRSVAGPGADHWLGERLREGEATVTGPRTYTTTVTPEAAAALAADVPYFTAASITVEGYTHETAQDSADSLLGWLMTDLVFDGGDVHVDVTDSRGDLHGVDVNPRRVLRTLLIREAAGLLDPDEVHDNPEYLRGMIELTCRTLGLVTEGNREDVEAAIVVEVQRQNAGLLSERATRQARGDLGYEG